MIRVALAFLLISVLSWRGQGFVTVRSTAGRVTVSKNLGMVFDPSHFFDSASMFLSDAVDAVDPASVSVEASTPIASPDYIPGTSGEVTYSRASYYTILGLYVLSFPGLWSTIKRSTAAKVKRMTFVRYVRSHLAARDCIFVPSFPLRL